MNVVEAHIYKLNYRYKKNDNVNRYAVSGERERCCGNYGVQFGILIMVFCQGSIHYTFNGDVERGQSTSQDTFGIPSVLSRKSN